VIKINNNAMTHGGKFHADDVFSAALLRIVNPDIKIIRAFDVPEGFDGIVFDMGGGKFDHHQRDAEVRENGVPYAAFGLLWREFGESVLCAALCPPEKAAKEASRFDETFIEPLDADDNLNTGSQLAGVIGAFNPSWDSAESPDQRFFEALNFATIILNRKIDGIISVQRARDFVEGALFKSKDGIVVLPKFAPWKMVLSKSDAEFVVYPSQRGGFAAQAIPEDTDHKELKCSFPQDWAGKPEDELKRISGVDTLNFCHKGRFLITAGSLNDAVKACKLAGHKKRK